MPEACKSRGTIRERRKREFPRMLYERIDISKVSNAGKITTEEQPRDVSLAFHRDYFQINHTRPLLLT